MAGVVQAGVREPVHVAAEAATLDILAPGRVLLGIGAGHTPREWDDIGRVRPAPRQRAERLAEFADVVGLSGLGRTLPDGHHHEARWSMADLQRQLQLVREEAKRAGRHPIIEALVHVVAVTEDRAAVADETARRIAGVSAQDVARTPFALIGTHDEMAAQLRRQAEEFGITSYVVRESAMPDLARILTLVNSADY